MKLRLLIYFFILSNLMLSAKDKEPVDYVDPYIGNISHLLVPTYPTIQLPNSMLRVYPERYDYTSNNLHGLPIIVTSHRGSSAFNLSPYQGDENNLQKVINYGYDNEVVKPYFYQVNLDDYDIQVDYAVSHQSAIYQLNFKESLPPYLMLNTSNGKISVNSNTVSGFQNLDNDTKVYLFLEVDQKPQETGVILNHKIDQNKKSIAGKDACVVLKFGNNTKELKVRYGVSFISIEQAEKNMKREISDYDLKKVEDKGRKAWNETLGKIEVDGEDEAQKRIFYTSLYRIYERMICISEDGNYFSAYDGKIHSDNGVPFFTDDWIWDTYRAAHPLRIIIDPELESNMINSYIVMTQQMPEAWMPNFPEVTGDSRRMNSNHGVAMIADAYVKGLGGFDLSEAYDVSKAAITEKTLAPWSSKPSGILDKFYEKHGYFPSLAPGETETTPEVHSWERRQPVAVTLGTVYDEWCLSIIAKGLNKKDDHKYFSDRSFNYNKIFNPETKFFHPKDTFGIFMPDLDYRFPPGLGARDAYSENNGYVYKWDVPHNIDDLINLMGGKKAFVDELETMYNTPLGKGKWGFYATYPDHSGNVGQFSMGNEPSMHIPYLYNYVGQPWRTQKRVRTLLKQWFRDDLMGIPGDEDGGGLTAFVVFSQLGFYPVTPGLPMYVIGSPVFKTAKVHVRNNKTFEVECLNYSPDNKFIQSATLNGKPWNKSWFSHEDLMNGGKLLLEMGKYPNKEWASNEDAIPPSFSMEKHK